MIGVHRLAAIMATSIMDLVMDDGEEEGERVKKINDLLTSRADDIHVRDSKGRTLLHLAVINESLKIAELMLIKGVNVNSPIMRLLSV